MRQQKSSKATSELQFRCAVLQKQIENLGVQLKKKQDQCKQKDNVIRKLENQMEQMRKTLIKKETSQCQVSTEDLQLEEISKKAQLQSQNKKLKLDVQQLQSQNEKLKSQLQTAAGIRYSIAFCANSSVLNYDTCQHLYQHYLKKRFKKPIYQKYVTSKLIYRWDPKNPTNFHEYFDEKPNLLFVGKVSDERIIGAFSSIQIKEFDMESDENSELFYLLTKQQIESKYYEVSSNYEYAVQYDRYILIYGNSDFQIKTGELSVFSNLGTVNSYYGKTNKGKWDEFLGIEDHQLDLQTYEIYQLEFKK